MEWAGPVPAPEAASEPPVQESPAAQPAPSAAPVKRAVREHHEECDEELYEGGNCTCWSIKRFGPPSEREATGTTSDHSPIPLRPRACREGPGSRASRRDGAGRYQRRGMVTRTSARTTPVTGSRWTGA